MKKKPCLLILWLFLIMHPYESVANNGIRWTEGLTWEQVKQKAKQENKYIFLDCFATWCAPCKKMDLDVYTNDTVGSYFNEKFISVKVQMDKTKKDKWGLNVLAFDVELKDNEKKMRVDMLNDAKEMLEVAGVKNIVGMDGDGTPGRGIHEMGRARMGRDPKTSVLNAYNQVWDAKNVFVTDGACMTSASSVNPSLTYMALTARAADYAVSELKKGNL